MASLLVIAASSAIRAASAFLVPLQPISSANAERKGATCRREEPVFPKDPSSRIAPGRAGRYGRERVRVLIPSLQQQFANASQSIRAPLMFLRRLRISRPARPRCR
jgi:hypothetical protein